MLPPPRARARGQALVMFSLTVLLVAVMVCLTLGIGMKAREKAELQTMADAAAYSNAVVTARTFNSISLLNRVGIAHMVNAVSTQSLVAYGSAYRVALKAIAGAIDKRSQDDCTTPPAVGCDWCNRFLTLNTLAQAEVQRVDQGWDTYDRPTKGHLRTLQSRAAAIQGLQQNLHASLMVHLTGQALAATVAVRGDQGNKWIGEITAPPAADLVSVREAGGLAVCDIAAPQLVCLDAISQEPWIMATLGSRFYEISTNMGNLNRGIEEALETRLGLPRPDNEVNISQFEGSVRVADQRDPHAAPGGEGLMGEAHGRIRGEVYLDILCGRRNTGNWDRFDTFVFSSAETNFNYPDQHYFEWDMPPPPGNNTGTITELNPDHAFRACYDVFGNPEACGIFPGFVDLNPGHVDPNNRLAHLYGQPKNIAVMQRDYRFRCAQAGGMANCSDVDPWNLFFTARIRPSGPQEELDNRGLVTGPPGSLDISKMTAVAAGLTYYHRMNHWREPPNLLNPYWRATLVSPGIDSQGDPGQGGTDIQQVLAGAPFAVTVTNELQAQGFRGWQ